MDGLYATPVRAKRLTPGWYVARHRLSKPGTQWSLVRVYCLEDGDETNIAVLQAGSDKPEKLSNWRFRARIIGVEAIPDRPKPIPQVEAAQIIPMRITPQPVRACL